MTTNKIVFWASDYSDKSGEGKLALLFVNRLKKYNKNNKTKLIKSIFTKTNKKGNKIFFSSWIHKYLGSIYGAGNLWYYYFRGYKTCYLNYLPLWNFLIFLFLPPNSILGPIPGSVSRSNSFFLKKVLERISVPIIKLRYKKVIFSNNFYPIDSTKQKKALKEILQKAKIKTKKNHFKKINFDSHFESLI